MSAYYNENDPFAAAWLRELMRDGLIAPGWVDDRSIWDVRPCDVEGFTQCHFFAGIGVWSLALRVAGWPDDRPCWTGSAPCQPFSAAGKGAGFADERHLWPAWFHLIAHGKRQHIPVLGEQVAAKAGRAWFDLVSADMEALDHACGALDTCAAGLGAPFIGQRLYWLASAHSREQRPREIRRPGDPAQDTDRQAVELGDVGRVCGLAAPNSQRQSRIDSLLWAETERRIGTREVLQTAGLCSNDRLAASESLGSGDRPELGGTSRTDQVGTGERQWVRSERVDGSDVSGLAAPTGGQPRHRDIQSSGQHRQQPENSSDSDDGGIPLHPVEYWRDADWLLCRDPNGARFRPVEPSTLTMADGRTVRWRVADGCGEGEEITTHFPLAQAGEYLNRLNEVRGAGNALNIAQAATFCEIAKDYLDGVPVE